MSELSKLSTSQMLKSYNEKVTLTCKCGKQFETYKIFDSVILKIESGLCFECREKRRQEQERQEKEALGLKANERKEGWHRACGISLRFQGKNFNNFKVKKDNELAFDASQSYADSFPLVRTPYHSLGIISDGTWGCGKTHLVSSIGHRIIDRWISGEKCPVYYVTEPQMFSRIRATYNRSDNGETEQELFEKMINIPLLIIDDVGKEEVADPRFVQRVWFRIINGRYDNMLPIVLTANMSPDGIAHHLGGSRDNEASFDRLYEMLNGVFFQIGGQSFRRQNIRRGE